LHFGIARHGRASTGSGTAWQISGTIVAMPFGAAVQCNANAKFQYESGAATHRAVPDPV